MTNKEYANALRLIADFYEANPEIKIPGTSMVNYSMDGKENAVAVMRALGSCKKEYSDSLMDLTKNFGGINLRFCFSREGVCTRKVVRTEEVPAEEIPAYTRDAYTKEIVEWECEPLLAPDAS